MVKTRTKGVVSKRLLKANSKQTPCPAGRRAERCPGIMDFTYCRNKSGIN